MTGPLMVYTTSSCAPCRTLKQFLDYKQIPYETTVIDDNEAAQKLIVEKTGRYIVPTVKVNDNTWISGYRPADIMEVIGNDT